jgi:hypothetical protein
MSCCNGKLTMRAVAHGAVGLLKSRMRIGLTDDATIGARRSICRACEHSEKRTGPDGAVKMRRCNLCQCLLRDKTRLKSEKCCADKW